MLAAVRVAYEDAEDLAAAPSAPAVASVMTVCESGSNAALSRSSRKVRPKRQLSARTEQRARSPSWIAVAIVVVPAAKIAPYELSPAPYSYATKLRTPSPSWSQSRRTWPPSTRASASSAVRTSVCDDCCTASTSCSRWIGSYSASTEVMVSWFPITTPFTVPTSPKVAPNRQPSVAAGQPAPAHSATSVNGPRERRS